MRRVGCLVLLVALATLALISVDFLHGWTAQGPLERPATIVVAEGSTLRGTARQLEKLGAIRSDGSFLRRARVLGSDAPIKAGEYVLPEGVSNRDILALLQSGKTVNHLVTIPEGMPSILVHERLMANKELTGTVPVPAEGSVLPDSYAYKKGETRAAVLARMQKAMSGYLAQAWAKRGKDIVVKTPEQAITLASIVEKETAIAAERPIVAGVYQNRLRTGMMLQADPTIIYPITKGKPLGRRIRRSEITAVNDYNTYAMTGLPKGPIANPGRTSIDAVLNPAATKALYFVADGKGGHIFANTLEEHNRNVRDWFKIRRARGEIE
ncbi:endolytic transglycosylase MltG [Sphingobium sp. CR28]|uniref:endolytic transglycosylase MltG n=1 Tax=Sphingobium sp. CR28 TaxID=3400272 RepID=UPI003FEF3DA2